MALNTPLTMSGGNAGAYPVSGTCQTGEGNVSVVIGTAPHTATETFTCVGGSFSGTMAVPSSVADGQSVPITAYQTNADGFEAHATPKTLLKDTIPPTGTITADETDPTTGNVELTLTVDEPIATPSGWTPVGTDGKTFKRILTNNENGTVNLVDAVGNNSTVSYTVNNIDRQNPVIGSVTVDISGGVNNPTFTLSGYDLGSA